jgi:GNAT superfamily N-acetyltransferase
MSLIDVRAVSNKKEQRQFLNLPWKLHQNDPNWIPPLRTNQKEVVGFKKHPFYLDAEGQTFIAVRDGETVGRIMALIDHGHNRRYEEKRGMFGFFESVNDERVSSALFDASVQWLKNRNMTAIRGPLNPSMNNEIGLLVEGFNSPPTFMMTYNPEYYPELVEKYGFEKAHDAFAFYGHASMLDTLDPKIFDLAAQAAKKMNVSVRSINRKTFYQDVRTFVEIYNKSLPGQWGFVPLSNAEVDHMAAGLKHLIIPEMTSIAEVDGEPVGAVFGLLDYNPLIKEIDGRLFPFGFLKLLYGRKRVKRVRIISANVLPQYQKWGLGIILLKRILPEAINFGMQEAEFSWVLESNKLSRGSLERAGAQRIKTYRIYDKSIN